MDTIQAKLLFVGLTSDTSSLLFQFLIVLLSMLAALLGLGYGLRHVALWIYNGGLGESVRHFGTPPWKGYKWYRSKKWNMEHTL